MNPGEWEDHLINWPSGDHRHYAIHMIHLPTDELLVWGRRTTEELVVGVRCHLWNRDSGTFTQVIHDQADIFCAGHAQMGDGRIVATGGGYPGGFPFPPRETARFDRSPDQWMLLPHAHFGRWYPTMTTLPDGRPMMFAGWYEVISGFTNINATIPEYYDPARNLWVLMHEAERERGTDETLLRATAPRL